MNILKQIVAGLRENVRDLLFTRHGLIAVALVWAFQLVLWLMTEDGYGSLLFSWLYTVVGGLLFVSVVQFLSGVVFAVVHARRPKHSILVLELQDGRKRRGVVCAAPCCVQAKVKRAFRTERGRIVLDLGDGSDNEEFGRADVEDWWVLPLDNPDPHGLQTAGED